MNYFEKAESFANENFSNYDGWSNFTDDYNYADGQGSGTALASLPFVINIANSTTDDVADVIFLNANLAGSASAPAFGNDAAITITMDSTDISYAEFLQSIKSEPFKVGQIYLESANTSQPYKALTVINKDSTGRKLTTPINPRRDPNQFQAGVVVVKSEFTVDSYTAISTTILASATLTISLYPKEQLNVARTLDGRTASKMYARPDLSQNLSAGNGRLIG
jgi:hypothetical protein